MTPEVETRLWQRLIAVEAAVEKMNKAIENLERIFGLLNSRVNGIESAVTDPKNGMVKDIEDLYKRLKILEEARQRQIALNSTFIQKDVINPPFAPKKVPIKEVKSFWPWK